MCEQIHNGAGIFIQNNFIPFSHSKAFLGLSIDVHRGSHMSIISRKFAKGSGTMSKLETLFSEDDSHGLQFSYIAFHYLLVVPLFFFVCFFLGGGRG